MTVIINRNFVMVRNLITDDVMFDIDTLTLERFKVKYKIPLHVEIEIDFDDLEDEDEDEYLALAIQEAGLGKDYIQDYRKQTQKEDD